MRGTCALGRGVTLVGVLIAVVVATIAVAIAIPLYRRQALRAQRAHAIAVLAQIQAAEERFFLHNNRYSAELGGAPPLGLGLALPAASGYAIRLEAHNSGRLVGFTARASLTATAALADRTCMSFVINQNGIRGATDALGTDRTDECWRGAGEH